MSTVIPAGEYYFYHKGYPLSTEEQAKDLAKVVAQYSNRVVSEKLQRVCDKEFERLFQIYLENKGKSYNITYFKMLIKSLEPIIVNLKNYYDRPRPTALAEKMGIDFKGDHLGSAQTPSYPSGHTIQAYVLAHVLSEQFPEHEENLLKIAEMISQSRIDRGVHFPTDIEHGREIASSIFSQMKHKTPETPDFKQVYDQNYY